MVSKQMSMTLAQHIVKWNNGKHLNMLHHVILHMKTKKEIVPLCCLFKAQKSMLSKADIKKIAKKMLFQNSSFVGCILQGTFCWQTLRMYSLCYV